MSARILIVEDTVQNVQTLTSILKGDGYVLSVATNGRQALAALERVRPDLILLDVMMPELNGFDTCRAIKQVEAWRDIPIIFLTSRTETADVVEGFEVGAVDYVAKPFNAHELLARVNTHLTVDQLRRSLSAKNEELAVAHALVRGAFGRYVSEAVAESLLGSPDALDLGGEERDVTLLMSDLRGFTALAERHTPHQVIEFLNIYLEAMVDVIGKYQGTIDEIIGDGILVIFGAPVRSEDHAATAVACGLSMQLAMREVNQKLTAQGATPLEMGIGIHTGRVIVGNIGSLQRTKYAAVGSNVNMTGRIESFTTGGQVLVSEFTRGHISAELNIRRSFEVEPKGASRAITLFDVIGLGAPHQLALPVVEVVLRPVDPPISVSYTLLEEKFVGRSVMAGHFTALASNEACMTSEAPIPPLRNLRIEIPADGARPSGEIYAKVLESSPRSLRVRFTSISPELKPWLASWG